MILLISSCVIILGNYTYKYKSSFSLIFLERLYPIFFLNYIWILELPFFVVVAIIYKFFIF